MKAFVSVVVFLLAGCPSKSAVEVRTWGTLRAVMHEGKTGPQVVLSDVSGPKAYALGALSEMRGEVMILAGRVYVSTPNPHGEGTVLAETQSSEGAMLLVGANVPSWKRVPISEDIPAEALDARIEAMAAQAGIETEKPFPFLIEGNFKEVGWHVLDPRKLSAPTGHEDHSRASIRGMLSDAEGTVLGFFSRHHAGVFTHMGQRTHLHVLIPAQKLMGHVETTGVRAGSVLLLPKP